MRLVSLGVTLLKSSPSMKLTKRSSKDTLRRLSSLHVGRKSKHTLSWKVASPDSELPVLRMAPGVLFEGCGQIP